MLSSDPPASVSILEVEPLLTTEEAARQLGVTANWLRYMCREGKIKAIKFPGSRKWRFLQSEIDKLRNGDKLSA